METQANQQTPAPTPTPVNQSPEPAPVTTQGASPASSTPDYGLTGERPQAQVGPRARTEEGPSLEEILRFDPFGPPPATPPVTPPAATPAPTIATPPPTPAPQAAPPAPTPPPAPPAPAAPDPRDARIADLEQKINALRGAITAQQQQPNGATAPGAANAAAPAEEPIEFPQTDYQIGIPDAMIAGLAAEDPAVRKQNMEALVRGTAKIIHAEVIKMMRKEVDTRLPGRFQQLFQVQQEHQRIRDDYFGKFPTHRNFAPLVSQITSQVLQAYGNPPWSEAVRDMVGSQVNNYLMAAMAAGQAPPMTAPQVVPPAPGQVPAPAAPAPVATPGASSHPHVFGGNASPIVATAPSGVLPPNSPDAISRTIF